MAHGCNGGGTSAHFDGTRDDSDPGGGSDLRKRSKLIIKNDPITNLRERKVWIGVSPNGEETLVFAGAAAVENISRHTAVDINGTIDFAEGKSSRNPG